MFDLFRLLRFLLCQLHWQLIVVIRVARVIHEAIGLGAVDNLHFELFGVHTFLGRFV
jgi:hypothetical protein